MQNGEVVGKKFEVRLSQGWKQYTGLHKKRSRREQGQFIAEGMRFCREALDSGWPVAAAFAGEGFAVSDKWEPWESELMAREIPITIISDANLRRLSQTEHPQGLVLIMEIPPRNILPAASGSPELVIALDGVRDPGNLGTLIRIADWYGAAALLLSQDCVDPFNDKVLRSSMGSIFRVPVLEGDFFQSLGEYAAAGFQLWATVVDGTEILDEVAPEGPVVLLLGGETSGLSAEVLAMAHRSVRIRGYGAAESLNVAVAGAVCAERLALQIHNMKQK
ncbi:MAG TPA: RNA methyltransferase [Calditrichia bacterium]|nr:RNA methyltransferase [Calditrichia bacterium]